MEHVRLGIIGLGAMGQGHAANVLEGKVSGAMLAAVCDPSAHNRDRYPAAAKFDTVEAMLAADAVDAVLIATPHFSHPTIGAAALEAGRHVLVEKPIAVHVGDAQRLLTARAAHPEPVFAAMFNQRTDPYFQTIRRLVQSGELGPVRRVQWTITDWFRTAAYYRSNAWRATWAGEGGGVLLNQCPHNLDLFQWIFGMPRRVTGHCTFGRYHDIEVEDDVTAYFEYPDGGHATFITSTGEAPGTNRLEIAADKGRLVYEADRLVWQKNAIPMTEFSRTSQERFAKPPITEVALPVTGHGGQHVETLQNFIDAILRRTPLIAPAEDGIRSVELANAILLSAWLGAPVELPVDPTLYERELKHRITKNRINGRNMTTDSE